MKNYFRFAASRPIINLLFIALLTMMFGSGLSKLSIRNNQDSELPKTDPVVITKEKIDEVFGDKSTVIVGIKADNIYKTRILKIVSAISDEIKNVPFVIRDDVDSLVTVNNIRNDEWGLTIDSFVNRKNINSGDMQAIKDSVDSNELISGRLVNTAGTFTVVVANVEEGFDQAQVHAAVNNLIDKYKVDGVEFFLSGDPIFRQDIDSGIQADIAIFMPLALLLVCMMIFFFFRSLRAVGLTVLTVVLTIVWTLGFMGLVGLPMTVVSSALPPLVVVLGGSYCIHYLLVYFQITSKMEGASKAVILENVLNKIYSPLLMVGFTSALGAFTLIAFDIVSIKEFAICVTVSVLFTVFISLSLMSSVLALLPVQVRKIGVEEGGLTRIILAITKFAVNSPRKVIFGAVVMLAISIGGITKIGLGVDIVSLFPEDHKGRQAFEMINDSLGGARFMNVMINTGTVDGIKNPEVLKVIDDYQTFVKNLPGVTYADSFVDVLKKLNKELGPEQQYTLPVSRDLLSQYLFLYDISGEPGDFSDLIDYDYQSLKIQLLIDSSLPDDHREIYLQSKAYLEQNLPQGMTAEFGGDVIFWVAQNDYIAIGKVWNVISCIFLVTIVISLSFRSLRLGLIGIAPIALGAISTFGILGWAGMRLDFPTAIITGVSVGIGIDFAVHYLAKLKQAAGDSFTKENIYSASKIAGKAISIDALSNIIGFLVLALSGFTAVKNFGLLVAFAMVVMSVATLVLVPACLVLWPYKASKKAPELVKEPSAVTA